jgi:NAD-dependent SIR2 family protein deacetylase
VYRDFDVTQHRVDDALMVDTVHGTGRRCEVCNRFLRDNLVHFGEDLEPAILSRATAAAARAEVALVLGTSLRVVPAMDLPPMATRGFVIVTLQRTPLDERASVVLRCKTDRFVALLNAELLRISGSSTV